MHMRDVIGSAGPGDEKRQLLPVVSAWVPVLCNECDKNFEFYSTPLLAYVVNISDKK